jgi:hypothetical protein
MLGLRDGGKHAVLTLARSLAGVHQHNAAGAVGVFYAAAQAGLPEQRRLLVARVSGEGTFTPLLVWP